MKPALARVHKINAIKSMIYQADAKGLAVDEEKLINHLGLEWGIARRKMLEYLKSLEAGDFIERKFKQIFVKKQLISEGASDEADKILSEHTKGEETNENTLQKLP